MDGRPLAEHHGNSSVNWCSPCPCDGKQLDLRPGSGNSNPSEFTVVGNEVYFFCSTPQFGEELWRTDGTVAGTQLVVDLAPGSLSSGPAQLTAGAGELYFTANVGGVSTILRTDGTAAGTVAVTDTGTSDPQSFRDLTWTQAGLFFLHDDDTGKGRELWRTSGSLSTTQMVFDIAPGLANGPVPGTLLSAIGDTQLHFAANNLSDGLQLWLSNGTAASTQQVTSFGGQGFGAVLLSDLYSDGARTFFACDDGVSGVEPWVYDPSNSSVSFVLPYGSPCAGSNGDPQIGAVGLPTVGNASFALTVSQAQPQSLALPFGSEGASNIPVGGGCRLLLDLPLVPLTTLTTGAAGGATFPLPIPNDPNLVGLSLFFQWGVLDPQGAALNGFSATGGLQAQVGN